MYNHYEIYYYYYYYYVLYCSHYVLLRTYRY